MPHRNTSLRQHTASSASYPVCNSPSIRRSSNVEAFHAGLPLVAVRASGARSRFCFSTLCFSNLATRWRWIHFPLPTPATSASSAALAAASAAAASSSEGTGASRSIFRHRLCTVMSRDRLRHLALKPFKSRVISGRKSSSMRTDSRVTWRRNSAFSRYFAAMSFSKRRGKVFGRDCAVVVLAFHPATFRVGLYRAVYPVFLTANDPPPAFAGLLYRWVLGRSSVFFCSFTARPAACRSRNRCTAALSNSLSGISIVGTSSSMLNVPYPYKMTRQTWAGDCCCRFCVTCEQVNVTTVPHFG